MEFVLVDTNVFSYLLRSNDTRADLYRPHIQGRKVAVSFVTVGELYYWAARNKWALGRIRDLEAHLNAATVVPYDHDICRAYANLKSSLRTMSGSHRLIGDNDFWIAACAVRHAVPLITHNRRHFEGIPGLNIICEAS